MEATATKTSTRACEWCAAPIPSDALRCPKCRNWRKDIDQRRAKARVWVIASGITGVFALPVGIGLLFLTLSEDALPRGGLVRTVLTLVIFAVLLVPFIQAVRYHVVVSRTIKSWWWF